ncbi:hypothetical protein CEP54_016293 [Fusarium duplospermum]|uniref:Uncharacterized protein n=1 Tax=Fusarium duplospermum TaxID=1325734 RepID=A0A428NFQ3_9HYPO|nr:hypothetical protein CEP54_016293 [Fusarium duplospermum]
MQSYLSSRYLNSSNLMAPSQVMAAIALPLAFWDVPSPPRQKSARHFFLALCLAKANRSSMRFKSSEYAG